MTDLSPTPAALSEASDERLALEADTDAVRIALALLRGALPTGHRDHAEVDAAQIGVNNLVAAVTRLRAAAEAEAADRETVMNEAFMTGRIYAAMGEKESPMEIHAKLRENCEKAVRRERAARAPHSPAAGASET